MHTDTLIVMTTSRYYTVISLHPGHSNTDLIIDFVFIYTPWVITQDFTAKQIHQPFERKFTVMVNSSEPK